MSSSLRPRQCRKDPKDVDLICVRFACVRPELNTLRIRRDKDDVLGAVVRLIKLRVREATMADGASG